MIVKLAITRWKKELPIIERFVGSLIQSTDAAKHAVKSNVRDLLGFRKYHSIDSLPISNPLKRATYIRLNNHEAKAAKLNPSALNGYLENQKSMGVSLEDTTESIRWNMRGLAKDIETHPHVKGNPLHGYSNVPYQLLGTKNKHINVFHGSKTLTPDKIKNTSIYSPSSGRIRQNINTTWASTEKEDASDYGKLVRSFVPMRSMVAANNTHIVIPSHEFIKGLQK